MLNRPTDLDFLTIQAKHTFDDAGRIRGVYGLTIACTQDRRALWIGSDLPSAVANEVIEAVNATIRSENPAEPPAALEICRRIIEGNHNSTMHCRSGPSFIFPKTISHVCSTCIIRSDSSNIDTLRDANPGNWHPVEWIELLRGDLGPWAMALEDGTVVSICHTPLPLTTNAAECGVWTAPNFRGRGQGASVTSEWAAIVGKSGRHLFYQTDAENLSSQRLAHRLNLRPIGWLWHLETLSEQETNVHCLSSVRLP